MNMLENMPNRKKLIQRLQQLADVIDPEKRKDVYKLILNLKDEKK